MEIILKTNASREVIDITEKISVHTGKSSKLVNIYVAHTTCGITTADLDPGAGEDLADAVWKMIPKLEYSRHHDPSHFPSHVAHSVIGPSLSIPVLDGKLILGTWQRIVFVELDGPKHRKVIVTNL